VLAGLKSGGALIASMPELTRRRSLDASEECWHVYYGDVRVGTIAIQARADFEAAWREFLSRRTEADFETWRAQRDWTERKYAMWQASERMPSQKPSSKMTCRCGQVFDSHRLEDTRVHVPHISAAASEHAR
jgi:hypothetical protein